MSKELISTLIDLRKSVSRFSNNVAKVWAINEHRCPRCNRTITSVIEYNYINEFGFCFACDEEKGGNL